MKNPIAKGEKMNGLVLYYSYGGNTRRIAEQIQKVLGCDLAEIATVAPYTGSYDEIVSQGQREADSGFKPLSTLWLRTRAIMIPSFWARRSGGTRQLRR